MSGLVDCFRDFAFVGLDGCWLGVLFLVDFRGFWLVLIGLFGLMLFVLCDLGGLLSFDVWKMLVFMGHWFIGLVAILLIFVFVYLI